MPQPDGSKVANRLAPSAASTRRVYPRRLTTVALAPLLAIAAACGGHKRQDTYQHATAIEQQCCEHLTGAPRDQCLQSIVRVSDPAVASSSTNQDTFACVEDHFVCDAQTGRATKQSAQAQLDCIADLQQ
jgi:hypothetical protein